MREIRKPSIVDTITPLQVRAWQAEHDAIEVERSGYGAFKSYHLDAALELRKADMHNKIQDLFERSDAQNAILDGIEQAKTLGHDIPIITMEQGIDYTLMTQ